MRRIDFPSLLKSPADREIISRWTRPAGAGHELLLPQPPDPERFSFLALGDTGDSESHDAGTSPQDAVAACMAEDAALPGSRGAAQLLLHTGDVIYMTGERRLYDRNFRRPYAPFLTEESTVDDLVFRLPFLPVPGNHDYYDLSRWARMLSLTPGLGEGVRAIARELFAYSLSVGGSDQGRAYMDSFIAPDGASLAEPLRYRPGQLTRLPNRYYRFQYGSVDFFALDSNTLEAPPPSETPRAREEATKYVRLLQQKARTIDRELRRDREAVERWIDQYRRELLHEGVPDDLFGATREVAGALTQLCELLPALRADRGECEQALGAAEIARSRWLACSRDLETAASPTLMLRVIEALDGAGDLCCEASRKLDGCLAPLHNNPLRVAASDAGAALRESLQRWSRLANGEPPPELCRRLHSLAEAGIDTQRELTRERGRTRYRPHDYDEEQLRWLDQALSESVRARPDHWRVIYMHHPLYTTISNHCEHSDVHGVRGNLLELLRGRVDLVLSGHSHAFEWLRVGELPHTGLFVTGGGGQVSLWRSVLDPRRYNRYRDRYRALRAASVTECAVSGRGPTAADGAAGKLYHYLRIEVTPEALVVKPIGVRRVGASYRREEPMPAFHAADLPDDAPPWLPRKLRAVAVRRGRPPEADWT